MSNVSTPSMYRVEHLFGPPNGDSGGGIGVRMGVRKTLAAAIALGADRLLNQYEADRSPHDRIMIKRRWPGHPEHPTWLYLDADGRLCMWRRHPSQELELWGYAS